MILSVSKPRYTTNRALSRNKPQTGLEKALRGLKRRITNHQSKGYDMEAILSHVLAASIGALVGMAALALLVVGGDGQ